MLAGTVAYNRKDFALAVKGLGTGARELASGF